MERAYSAFGETWQCDFDCSLQMTRIFCLRQLPFCHLPSCFLWRRFDLCPSVPMDRNPAVYVGKARSAAVQRHAPQSPPSTQQRRSPHLGSNRCYQPCSAHAMLVPKMACQLQFATTSTCRDADRFMKCVRSASLNLRSTRLAGVLRHLGKCSAAQRSCFPSRC